MSPAVRTESLSGYTAPVSLAGTGPIWDVPGHHPYVSLTSLQPHHGYLLWGLRSPQARNTERPEV